MLDNNLEYDNTAGVSVIICCYNSAARLPATLQHLAQQILPPGFSMEIILVNNASTDNTVSLAEETWKKFDLKNGQSKVVDEPKAGQMFARIKGAQEAKFETLVFCDDDNWLDENYVSLAYRLLQKDGMIGAGGGQNLPVTNADAYPEWFDEYKDNYGLGIPAEKSGDVSNKTFVLGAGLITRKSLFLKIFTNEYPSLLNGRDGKKLSTGDDFEYCKRLLLWDYKLYYDENLKLQHFIPKERLTIEYRDKLMQGIKEAGKILMEYDLAIHIYKKNKNKNRWRLLLLSPFRILFSKLGLSKRVTADEQLTFFYSLPIQFNSNPVRSIIKKFIHHK
jgi:glycosyltransferase involved in cell wall biosynthesis